MATASESMENGNYGDDRSSEAARTQGRVDRMGFRALEPRHLNRALGWFSIGLGMMELLAPRSLGRMIGAGENHGTTLRLCGVREIASGISLLSERAPAASAMSRVAGDAMDLALLGAALRSPDAHPGRLAVAATTVLGVTALDLYASERQARQALSSAEASVPAKVSIAINSPPEKLYEFWRNFENLPRFMEHLESVRRTGEQTSHWVAKGPAGAAVEWDAELVDDRPNTLLAWRTLPGSDVWHHGSVRFDPAGDGRGTIVEVDIEYGAPAGKFGAAIAKLFGQEPRLQISRDLRLLKQLLEAGEVATTRGQPSGARSLLGRTLTRRES